MIVSFLLPTAFVSDKRRRGVPAERAGRGVLPLTAKHVSLGYNHNCAILSDDNAYCWGVDYAAGNSSSSVSVPSLVSLDSTVLLVETGYSHSCAILSNGSVQCWGSNYHGQLGVGYTCEYQLGECTAEGYSSSLETPVYASLPLGSTAVGLNLWDSNTCVIFTKRF